MTNEQEQVDWFKLSNDDKLKNVEDQELIINKFKNGDMSVFNLIKNPSNELIIIYIDKLYEKNAIYYINNCFENSNFEPIIYEIYVNKYYPFIRFVPKEKRTQQLYNIVFTKLDNYYNFQYYVPVDFQTNLMYQTMLENDIYNVKYIPLERIKNISNELCIIIYNIINKTNEKIFNNDMFKSFLKYEILCHISLYHNGLLLKDCPFKTYENCQISYEQNKGAYNFIPFYMKMCMI